MPSTAPFRIVCPGCLARFAAEDRSLHGKYVTCKKCGHGFAATVINADEQVPGSSNTDTALPAVVTDRIS